MCLYIFFFSKFVFQFVNMSFMSPIRTLYHVSGFSKPAYDNTIFPRFFTRNIQPEKNSISSLKISDVFTNI